MNKKSILHLLIFLLFTGCSASKQNKKQNANGLDESADNVIKVDHSQTDTLHIPIGKKRPVKMSKLFSSIHYLPLQSKKAKLIGRIRKITFTVGKIFIFDRSRPAVFIYDSDGHFINMISIPKGGGPAELIRPTDMVITPSKKQISVLGMERINTYNYAGDVVRDLRLQTIPYKFTRLSDGEFVLYMHNYLYNGGPFGVTGHNLLFINSDGTRTKQALPIKKSHAGLQFIAFDNFPSYAGHQLFYGFPDRHIYGLTNDSLTVRYYLDFGKYNVPKSMYQSRTNFSESVPFINKVLKKGYVSMLNGFLETDNLIKFDIVAAKTSLQIFYSKQTGHIFVASKLVNDIDYGPSPYPSFHKRDQLVAFIEPSDLIKKAKAIKKKLTPEQLKQYRQRPQNLIDLTKNMTPMNNPVLMFCKVKSTF
jgi:hypothetical protein